jgi:ADP-ribose pyrophosphatase YjhB (NUDIX family)
MTKYFLPRAEFEAIYARVPRLTVELVVETPDGIILTQRAMEPRKGDWHIPGGTVLFGETLADAIYRIAEDELGVDVEINKLLGYIEYPGLLADGYKGWPVGIAFRLHISNGTPRGSDQGEKLGFFKTAPPNTFPDQAAWLNEHVFHEA